MKMIPCALLAVSLVLPLVSLRADSIYKIPFKDINGADATLEPYKGNVLMIVNVASKCGFTPQYKALEALHERYKADGFSVVAFPCNQFGDQEPGTNQEIQHFCSVNYHVTFPLADKIDVNGPQRHPLYAALAGPDSPFPGDLKWNFTKFLLGRDGKIVQRFEPPVKPDAPQVIQAIEAALAVK